MSQVDFADAIGRSQTMVSMYEKGQRLPSTKLMTVIAEALRIPLAVLYFSDDELPDHTSELYYMKSIPGSDDEVMQKRKDLRDDPDRRTLLDFAEHGNPKAIKTIAAMIDAFKATNPDFYDGDDPA